MVAGTSLLAYESIKKKLGERQEQVYRAIEAMGVATAEQVAGYLGLPIQSVTGRITELRKYGMVGVEGVGLNKSGHKAKLWSIRNPDDTKVIEKANDCEG